MGRPKGSLNKSKKTRATQKHVTKQTRTRKESFEESVIMLAKTLEVKINPGVSFDKLLGKVKNKCRSKSAQTVLCDCPETYNRWVNVLMREACV